MSPSPQEIIKVPGKMLGDSRIERVELLTVETVAQEAANKFIEERCYLWPYNPGLDMRSDFPEQLFYIPQPEPTKDLEASHLELVSRMCNFAHYDNDKAGYLPGVVAWGKEARQNLQEFYQTTVELESGKTTGIVIAHEPDKKFTLKAGEKFDLSHELINNKSLHAFIALPEEAQKRVFETVNKQGKATITVDMPPTYEGKIGLDPLLKITKGENPGEYLLTKHEDWFAPENPAPYFAIFRGTSANFAEFAQSLGLKT